MSVSESEVSNMDLDWISPAQAAEKWGITIRQVQYLCSRKKIEGLARLGHAWLIPKDAPKPLDGRTKAAKLEKDGER
jgi:hypothetical protein